MNAVNDTPALTTINDQETSEDTDITVDLSGSDVDIGTNGQTLTFTATSGDPSIVLVSTTSTGSSTATLSLDVQDDANGDVTVTVEVSDGNGGTAEQDFTLTVTEVNDIPVATASSFSTNEDNEGETTLTGNDGDPWNSDADDQDLTYAIVSGVSNGTLSLNPSTGEVTYDPDDNFNGSDSFTFTVTDDGTTDGNSDALTSTVATVSITVNAVNDEPVITSISLPVDTLIYSNIDGQQQVIVYSEFEDIDSENLLINYFDNDSLIHTVNRPIDQESNNVLDTLNHIFNSGSHILNIIIQDDGDNEDDTVLNDSSIVNWKLGYATMTFDIPAYFVITDSIRTLPTLTISNGEIDSTINRENGLKLVLPDDSGIKWNSDQTSMSFDGNSSGYLNLEVDVSDDQLTLAFTVESDFSSGDHILINNLSIVDLMEVQGPTKVRMVVDGESYYGTANSQTEETITLGDTRVELSKTTAFSIGDPSSILAPTIMIWENSPYNVINKEIGINLRIPIGLHCNWGQIGNENIQILRDDIDISNSVIDTIIVSADTLLSISLLEDLQSDDSVKVSGAIFNDFETISFPNVISMAVTNPEPGQYHYFERSTVNTIRIGNPQIFSIGENILARDMDPSYADTLMPLQITEDVNVASITKDNGIVLTLPETSGLLWSEEQFGDIISSSVVEEVMLDEDNNLKIQLLDDLSAGDTLTIRKLPIMNMVSNSYNGYIDCSTNSTNFNRSDSQSLSVASAHIFSADENFLLNDTTLHILLYVVQDPDVMLIRQNYGVFITIDDSFPAIFDSTQQAITNTYSGETQYDSLVHISPKKIHMSLSTDISIGDTIQVMDLRFSEFSSRFYGNGLIYLSVKHEDHASFIDESYKGVGKPVIQSVPRVIVSASETSIAMPPVILWDDYQVPVLTTDRSISFILSENSGIIWQETPFLEITGAYDKVDPVPEISDDRKRISLNLTDDFSITDTVTVNGLRVLASGSGADHMYLSLNHTTYQDTLADWIRVGDVSFNSTDQLFLKNVDLGQRILSKIRIGQGETSIIDSVFDLIIRLPINSHFKWNLDQDPHYSFDNDLGGMVSNEILISDDQRSLTIPVINFPVGDTLSIDSLYFGDFTITDSIHLTLGLDGSNNTMILKDTAFKIISGFELDLDHSWNYVVGDTGEFSNLPTLNAFNDRFNTLNKTDIYITLPHENLTWSRELEFINIFKDSTFFTSYEVNRVNDSVMHIPRGLPISNDDSIYFTGLSLEELTDIVQPLTPRFEYSIQTGGGQSNNNNVNSKKSIGVGYPTIVYEDKISFPLDRDLNKYFPQITVHESSVPVFGLDRDLVVTIPDHAMNTTSFAIDSIILSEPAFIRSASKDSIHIGFFRNTQANESIQISEMVFSTEPFFSSENYLNVDSMESSFNVHVSISHTVEEKIRKNLIGSGPNVEFYPSLFFNDPVQYESNGNQKLSVEIFPSLINHESTDLQSIIQYSHLEISGLFENDLSDMYNTLEYHENVGSFLSSGSEVLVDKIVINLDESVSDSINRYADLNRFQAINNQLRLSLLRSGISFKENVDTSGFYIKRFTDDLYVDIGYDLDYCILEPLSGTVSNDRKDSLRLLLTEFPYERRMTINDFSNQVIFDAVLPEKNDSVIYILDQDLEDGFYNINITGVINDTIGTFPIIRQFKIDNHQPKFVQDNSDSLFSLLFSLGKNNSGHLVAKNEIFQFSIIDQDVQDSQERNNLSKFFFNDSLKMNFQIMEIQDPDMIFSKTEWIPSVAEDSLVPSFSMRFDSLLSFLMDSNEDQYMGKKNSYKLTIDVFDQAGNNNYKVMYFSTDMSGNKIGEEVFNYPNPFSNLHSEVTRIRYVVLDEQTSGDLYIMDLGGNLVFKKELNDQLLRIGSHEIIWEGVNVSGELLASGVYLGLLKIGNENKKIKMVIRN